MKSNLNGSSQNRYKPFSMVIPTVLIIASLSALVSATEKDSLNYPVDELESHVRSTLLFGGSNPVSFAGEARLKIQEHYLYDFPVFMDKDRSYTNANWEGNESFMRLGMVVRANRNTVLWSKIGFQHTMPGNYTNDKATGQAIVNAQADTGLAAWEQVQTRHDKTNITANIHEDMSAGMAIRTNSASFWLRMGNILWTEASPLTIWKAQPRTFAWDYLPFEVEQPIARYFEYSIAKGEKAGRAAWNKKALNGIQLESIQLPLGLYMNLMWADYERYDNFERSYVDFSNDIAYAGDGTGAKGLGIGDSYRHLLHIRLAKEKIGAGITAGLNLNWFHTSNDLYDNYLFRSRFEILSAVDYTPKYKKSEIPVGREFIQEPRIFTFDLKGPINENWSFQMDAGFSFLDTNWVRLSVDSMKIKEENKPDSIWVFKSNKIDSSTSLVKTFSPAFFGTLKHQGKIPFRIDAAVISKDFYSPLSFVTPVDAFFPFSSNLVGAGKFIARGEGSPYTRNMAGLNMSWTPNVGYGHFRLSYGQHAQLSSARDLIYFPHRLNGQDEFNFYQSSYNRWGNNLVDHSIGGAIFSGKFKRRMGDESYRTTEYKTPLGADAGGIRTDYLSAFEGFVPYENTEAADSNLAPSQKTTITTRSKWVPAHRKWTYNFELDGGYDIGPIIGYKRDFLVNAYLALNGVSAEPKALSIDEKNMMLWGTYARLEPAISIFTPRFYLVGLIGYENWKAEKAYATPVLATKSVLTPIDFIDLAYGMGCDWDFAERVGLHLRAKWLSHEDVQLSENSYHGRLLSAEIKMWF